MKNKGFTLVELLAVIVILGIIVAIAIPSYNAYIVNSNKNYYKTLESSVKTAGMEYFNNNLLGTSTQGRIEKEDILKNMKSITDPDGNDCRAYVDYKRNGINDYSFTPYIKCPNYTSDGYSNE